MSSEDPGVPLVVVHGLIHACADLRREGRGGVRPILVPDLPGYGENDPGTGTSIERCVAWLDVWMREEGIDEAHLAGHSAGGAIAMAFTHRFPGRVRSLVDIEGNFTLVDAFWSKGIAAGTEEEAEALLAGFRADVPAWLRGQAIDPMPGVVARARASLEAQAARTLRSMAGSVVDFTSRPAYLEDVARVMATGLPVHLVAGARSLSGWDVPGFVRAGASSLTVLAGVGHMMMLEDPQGLVETMERVLAGGRP